MRLADLSKKSRRTIEKIAAARGMKPADVLRYVVAISSRHSVSKHLARVLFVP